MLHHPAPCFRWCRVMSLFLVVILPDCRVAGKGLHHVLLPIHGEAGKGRFYLHHLFPPTI
jgi:hypothetical protein